MDKKTKQEINEIENFIMGVNYPHIPGNIWNNYGSSAFEEINQFCKIFEPKELMYLFREMDSYYGFSDPLTAEKYLAEKTYKCDSTYYQIKLLHKGRIYAEKVLQKYSAELIALRICNASSALNIITALMADTPFEVTKDKILEKDVYQASYKDASYLIHKNDIKEGIILVRYEYNGSSFKPLDIRNDIGTYYINQRRIIDELLLPTKKYIINELCHISTEEKDTNSVDASEEKDTSKNVEVDINIEFPDPIVQKLNFIHEYIIKNPADRKKAGKIEEFYIPEYKKICNTLALFDQVPNKEGLISYQKILAQKDDFEKIFDKYLDKVTESLFSDEIMENNATLKVAKQLNELG